MGRFLAETARADIVVGARQSRSDYTRFRLLSSRVFLLLVRLLFGTRLRDVNGTVWFIPNGEIKSVTNRTYVWGRAVLELPIAFSEDVDRVMEVILDEARAFREDEEKGEWVTDEPVMLGVDKFTEYGVVIKFMVQTLPDKIFPTRRELLRRIKKRFDSEGIKISVPHRLLVQETGDDVQP